MHTFKYRWYPHCVAAESAVWERGVRGRVDNRLLVVQLTLCACEALGSIPAQCPTWLRAQLG
ncbi:unnamed protein product [Chondrus crispus]|uniref:Uncharacterized protein n=1 Tax=Chondrus crispus TaxID=2769 RepID=R7Q163_CHOCR|nr:unnamed protein product [Chondrus crispus]CDF32367.1 unnamed protein product [Chondrus crispus]|eukprot:XP_005712032.1 unnamed protein product [Chondrus crispus]